MSGGAGERAVTAGSRKAVTLAIALLSFPALIAHAAVNDATLVTVTSASATGVAADSGSDVAVSPNGRFVAFDSRTTNLTDGLQPPAPGQQAISQIYIRDMQTGTTTLVSRALDGQPGDADSSRPAISPGGARYVAFESLATNLSAADDDSYSDVFLFDIRTGVTTLVSRGADGSPANGGRPRGIAAGRSARCL